MKIEDALTQWRWLAAEKEREHVICVSHCECLEEEKSLFFFFYFKMHDGVFQFKHQGGRRQGVAPTRRSAFRFDSPGGACSRLYLSNAVSEIAVVCANLSEKKEKERKNSSTTEHLQLFFWVCGPLLVTVFGVGEVWQWHQSRVGYFVDPSKRAVLLLSNRCGRAFVQESPK
jgi:hypothetical protein